MPFNRTSVELKLEVVMVPGNHDNLAFNRTSVELKLRFIVASIDGMSAFNRTSVELKPRANFFM